MNPRRVLVADGGPPSALAVARSLVRAGWRVEATRSAAGDRAPRSRGVVLVDAPSPARDPAGFVGAILRAGAAGGRGVLIPATDAAIVAVEARREEVESVWDIALPPSEVVARVQDKGLTLAAARAAGVRVPRGRVVRPGEEGEDPGSGPPWVLKPVRSRWAGVGGVVRGGGPSFARTREELRERLAPYFADGAPGVLVQEFVPGTGWGVGLWMRGRGPDQPVPDGLQTSTRPDMRVGSRVHTLEPGAVFVHRRLREVYPAGGPSAAAVAEAPDPAVVDPAVALLREIGWEGLAMVEFRRDGSGEPVLMEVNGRPWGTLGLAVDAGVDFPRLLLEGGDGPPPTYRVGMKRRWFAGDVRRIGAAWAGAPPGFPGVFPSPLAALGTALLSWSPDLVFRWSDPGPFLGELRGALS